MSSDRLKREPLKERHTLCSDVPCGSSYQPRGESLTSSSGGCIAAWHDGYRRSGIEGLVERHRQVNQSVTAALGELSDKHKSLVATVQSHSPNFGTSQPMVSPVKYLGKTPGKGSASEKVTSPLKKGDTSWIKNPQEMEMSQEEALEVQKEEAAPDRIPIAPPVEDIDLDFDNAMAACNSALARLASPLQSMPGTTAASASDGAVVVGEHVRETKESQFYTEMKEHQKSSQSCLEQLCLDCGWLETTVKRRRHVSGLRLLLASYNAERVRMLSRYKSAWRNNWAHAGWAERDELLTQQAMQIETLNDEKQRKENFLEQVEAGLSQEEPEDGVQDPMPPAIALAMYGKKLTPYEQTEILEYAQVYYLGTRARKVEP